MVVIAIVGVLAAIAIPSYAKYQARTQIVNSFNMMQVPVAYVVGQYQKTGSFPAGATLGGAISSGGTWVNVSNSGNIYSFSYFGPGSDGLSTLFGIQLTGLSGIPGYITPTTPAPPSSTTGANTIYIGIRDVSGIMRIICSGAINGQNPPADYLPSICQCPDVNDFWINGTGGC